MPSAVAAATSFRQSASYWPPAVLVWQLSLPVIWYRASSGSMLVLLLQYLGWVEVKLRSKQQHTHHWLSHDMKRMLLTCIL